MNSNIVVFELMTRAMKSLISGFHSVNIRQSVTSSPKKSFLFARAHTQTLKQNRTSVNDKRKGFKKNCVPTLPTLPTPNAAQTMKMRKDALFNQFTRELCFTDKMSPRRASYARHRKQPNGHQIYVRAVDLFRRCLSAVTWLKFSL